jgi:hypothetical protein
MQSHFIFDIQVQLKLGWVLKLSSAVLEYRRFAVGFVSHTRFVPGAEASKAPRRSLNILAADEGAMSTKVYHVVNLAILVNSIHRSSV